MKLFYQYNRTLLISFVLVLFVLVSTSMYMEPLEGGLTRIGGYLENNYGWRGKQRYFDEPLFDQVSSINEYNTYYDVIVLGDSFSQNQDYGWQNYFVNETGLSLITFSLRNTTINDILNYSEYKKKPPLIFIYESVERLLWHRHNKCNTQETETVKNIIPRTKLKQRLNKETFLRERVNVINITDVNMDVAANYLIKMSLRKILNVNLTKTIMFELNERGHFSNTYSGKILVYSDDLQKASLTDNNIITRGCDLLNIQNRIQSNQITQFIAMIPPDKLTAYSEYLANKKYSNIDIIPALSKINNLNVPRLDTGIKREIKNGLVDVYLPNDTHLSSLGYKIAAHEVVKYLTKESLK